MPRVELQADRRRIVIDGATIAAVDQAPRLGRGETVRVLPGFIDVHIHGAVGVDVNGADAAGLLRVAEFLAGRGVTAWMPTLVPDSDDNYRRAIDAINYLMVMQVGKPVAQAVGVHYEGVWA